MQCILAELADFSERVGHGNRSDADVLLADIGLFQAALIQRRHVMKRILSLATTPAALLFLAIPAPAQPATETGMDVADMTCSDIKALDKPQLRAISDEAMKMASMSDDEIAEMKTMVQEERDKSKSDQGAAMTEDEKAAQDKEKDAAVSALLDACGNDDSMMVLDAAKAAKK